MKTKNFRVERPVPAMRVGVTGTREIEEDRAADVHREVVDVLARIRLAVLAAAQAHPAVYGTEKPMLRIVSPLADGADRLVANEALAAGYQLDVILPFAQADYEASFGTAGTSQADSISAFRTLLVGAQNCILQLDGNAQPDAVRHASYTAVGRMIVNNSDLMIALWNSASTPRSGGTVETMTYARHNGVPVWCIDLAGTGSPKFLSGALDLGAGAGSGETDGGAMLSDFLRRLLAPPSEPPQHEGWWGKAIGRARFVLGAQASPLLAMLAERGRPNRRIWNAHTTLLGKLRRAGGRRVMRDAHTPVAEANGAVMSARAHRKFLPTLLSWFLAGFFLPALPFRRNPARAASSPAATLSRVYQDRYRTSYVFVFVFAAVAVIGAVIGTTFGRDYPAVDPVATVIELLALLMVSALIVSNEMFRWHQRYISYRTLGELTRAGGPLHRLGWRLIAPEVDSSDLRHGPGWESWYLAALARARPLPAQTFEPALLEAFRHRCCDVWIGEQIAFHNRRRREARGAAHILAAWGRALFLLTLALVLLRTGLMIEAAGEEISPWLSLACALLPAASAAFFGIRSYEEFEVLAEQSARMHEALVAARERLLRVPVDAPLASQRLARELSATARIMLSDVADWAQLFRMKVVEV